MNPNFLKRLASLCLVLLAILLLAGTGDAQEVVFNLDPAQSQVQFTLGDILHTVHGTFQFKNGMIRFNPSTGLASGELVVDATSGNSGNQSRDRRMHRQILEDQTYPEIVFTPQHISGQLSRQGTSQIEVQGVMTLHGGQHPLTLTMPVTVNGDQVTADTRFVVPYVKWGLKNPSTFILRVSQTVDIDVHAVGHLQPAARPSGL